MNIFPKIGVDNIKLGMKQKDVKALLGAPTNIEKVEEEDIWEFENGLELSFQAEDSYRLSSITVMADSALLDSKPIVGISESDLENIFPSFSLDEDLAGVNKNWRQ